MAALAADLVLSMLRNCGLAQRREQHPCASWRLRLLAAAESWLIAVLSEAGRLAGHLKRGSLRALCCGFDWFCGSLPTVVAEEQRRVALRAACLAAAAAWMALCRSV